MRNILLASMVALVMVAGASPAAALTIGDLQAQIQALLARVAELQARIQQSGGTSSSTPYTPLPADGANLPRICAMSYARSLGAGASGDSVKGLQEFLKSEGLLSAEATGYFGPLTEAALRRFQSENEIVSSGSAATTGWGQLGPRTWEIIRKRCASPGDERFSASPQRGVAPLTVTFKTNTRLSNPGMIADAGSYKVVFGDGEEYVFSCSGATPWCDGPHVVAHTYAANGTYTARLVHFGFFGPASVDTLNGVTVAERTVVVGSDVACTKEYKPVCGAKQVTCITAPCNPIQQTYNNTCLMQADGATYSYDGQCRKDADPSLDRRCKAWYDGCNNCARETADSAAACTLRACIVQGPAYCTAYFDSADANKPPVVSAFSGPTTLSTGQTGTWTVSASDPEGGSLSYSIDWGDARLYPFSTTANFASDFTQTTTFTHAYSGIGVFTVTMLVRDSAGKEAKTTATVRVGVDSIICTEEYAPVCGRPTGCVNNCPPGAYCTLMCQQPAPQTYANKCFMNAAGATFISEGACESVPVACTADAFQCPDGSYVGRSGPSCQFVCPNGAIY